MKVEWLIAFACSGCLSRPSPSTVSDAAPDAPVPHNFAFVTSTPRLISSFADLKALDDHCSMLAGMHEMPGNYVAWFSQPGTNAIERLTGYSGWVRPDLEPFADQPADIITGRIYNPLRITENRTDVGDGAVVATGTFDDGTYQAPLNDANCFGNASAPGYVGYGLSDATRHAWTWIGDNAIGCTSSVRFYCFEIDYQNSLSKPAHTGRLAFLSSAVTHGDVGTMSLDTKCQTEANNLMGQPHVIALVATNNQNPLSRFDLTGPPWVRSDGVQLMSGDGTRIYAPLNYTLSDEYLFGEAWTGATAIDATPNPSGTDNCNDWTTGTQTARAGTAARSSRTVGFGMGATNRCTDVSYHLYCFEP